MGVCEGSEGRVEGRPGGLFGVPLIGIFLMGEDRGTLCRLVFCIMSVGSGAVPKPTSATESGA